jgi:hypothetical protein
MPIKRKAKGKVETRRQVTMQVTFIEKGLEKYEGKPTPEQLRKLAEAYKKILGADDVVIKEIRDFTTE